MARRETPDDIKQRLAHGEPIQFVDARSQKSWEGSSEQAAGSMGFEEAQPGA